MGKINKEFGEMQGSCTGWSGRDWSVPGFHGSLLDQEEGPAAGLVEAQGPRLDFAPRRLAPETAGAHRELSGTGPRGPGNRSEPCPGVRSMACGISRGSHVVPSVLPLARGLP